MTILSLHWKKKNISHDESCPFSSLPTEDSIRNTHLSENRSDLVSKEGGKEGVSLKEVVRGASLELQLSTGSSSSEVCGL